MKRIGTILLAGLFLLSMAVGCGDTEASKTSASEAGERTQTAAQTAAPTESGSEAAPESAASAEESSAEASAPKVTYPLVTEPVTFTMFATASPQVTNVIGELNNHQGYIKAEEITGVNMDIQTVSMEAGSDQLTLIVASGDYPDLFRAANFTNGALDAYENDVIVDLSDYLEKDAPNYSQLIQSNQAISRDVETDEGYHLAFYRLYQENGAYDRCSVTQGMLIRQDLLEQAGLKAPTTIDEVTNVLETFQKNSQLTDPLLLQGSITNMGDSVISAYGIGSQFYVVDGTVHYGPTEESFREYLTQLNQWYSAGLLNADFYSYSTNPNDENIIGKITSADGVGIYFDSASNLKTRNEAADQGVRYAGMADLKGPDGKNHFGLDAAIVKGPSYYISTACDNVELAVQWNDFWYSDEGILLTNYGVEGVSFEYDANGNPQWTDLIVNNPDGLTQGVCRQVYLMYTQHGVCINDNEINMLDDTAKEAVQLWTDSSDRAYLMPSVAYTAEESTRRAALLNDITTLNDEVLLQMVIGQQKIETAWDTYQQNLKDMGIDEVLQITQAALDRYNAR